MVTMTLKKGNVATSHTLGAVGGFSTSWPSIVLSKNGTYNLSWSGDPTAFVGVSGTNTMDFGLWGGNPFEVGPMKAIVEERETDGDIVVLLNDMVDKSNKTEGYPKLIEFEHTSMEGYTDQQVYYLRLSIFFFTEDEVNQLRHFILLHDLQKGDQREEEGIAHFFHSNGNVVVVEEFAAETEVIMNIPSIYFPLMFE